MKRFFKNRWTKEQVCVAIFAFIVSACATAVIIWFLDLLADAILTSNYQK